ncbi:tcdB toxin N-terminal helical domain protein, partial [Chlamydia psittaci C6/98]
PMLH